MTNETFIVTEKTHAELRPGDLVWFEERRIIGGQGFDVIGKSIISELDTERTFLVEVKAQPEAGKTAEEILNEVCGSAGIISQPFIIKAMKMYANQFKAQCLPESETFEQWWEGHTEKHPDIKSHAFRISEFMIAEAAYEAGQQKIELTKEQQYDEDDLKTVYKMGKAGADLQTFIDNYNIT